MKFITDYDRGEDSLAEFCRQYGIQHRIGYKWVKRDDELSPEGLSDRSRIPSTHPNRTPNKIVGRIIKVRSDHPLWGRAKTRAIPARKYARDKPPAASVTKRFCPAGTHKEPLKSS